MPINSRAKGARAERELCQAIKEVLGWNARRSVQFCGNAGDADLIVEQAPTLFVEAKMVEKLNVSAAMEKAVAQSGGKVPALFHRRKRTEWLVTCQLSDLLALSLIVVTALKSSPEEPSGPESKSDSTLCPEC